MADFNGSGKVPPRSAQAEDIIENLIVRQGMSYAQAIRYCEEKAAPWLEVARELHEACNR